jgi:hypothetical protein
MTAYEFPFDITRALEFALYRTFAVPRISALLDQTGEFTRHTQKRYDDTDLILSTIYEYGYDSDQGRAALRRMNRLHGLAASPRRASPTCSSASAWTLYGGHRPSDRLLRAPRPTTDCGLDRRHLPR